MRTFVVALLIALGPMLGAGTSEAAQSPCLHGASGKYCTDQAEPVHHPRTTHTHRVAR